MAGQRIFNPGFQNPNIARAFQGLSQAFWGTETDGSSTQLDYAKIANQEAQARRHGADAALGEQRLGWAQQWMQAPETATGFGTDRSAIASALLGRTANPQNTAKGLQIGRGTHMLSGQVDGTSPPLTGDEMGIAFGLGGIPMPAGGYTRSEREAFQNRANKNALAQQQIISDAALQGQLGTAQAAAGAAKYGHDQNLKGTMHGHDQSLAAALGVGQQQAATAERGQDVTAQTQVTLGELQAGTAERGQDVDQATKLKIAAGREETAKAVGMNKNQLDYNASVFGASSMAEWQNARTKAQFDAAIAGHEMTKSVREYASDRVKEASAHEAELRLQGDNYAADQLLAAKKAEALLIFEGSKIQAEARIKFEKYAADKRYDGTVFGARMRKEWEQFAALKAMESNNYGIDIEKTWREYQADKGLEAAMFASDKDLEAKIYAADKMLEGNMYGAEVEKVWREKAAQLGLEGQKDAARIEQMWRMYSAELMLQGNNTAAHVEANWQNFRSKMGFEADKYAVDHAVRKPTDKNTPYEWTETDAETSRNETTKWLRGWLADPSGAPRFNNDEDQLELVPKGVWASLTPDVQAATEQAGGKWRGKSKAATRELTIKVMKQGLIEINTEFGDGVDDFYMPKTIVNALAKVIKESRSPSSQVTPEEARGRLIRNVAEKYQFNAKTARALMRYVEEEFMEAN